MRELMVRKSDFRFVDIQHRLLSEQIGLMFPAWKPGDERVVVLSPHDDDAVLGAGHLILASRAFGGEVHILIYSSGCLGYSRPQDKDTIVETRKAETFQAYEQLGVPRDSIHRLEMDDLSVLAYVGWRMPCGADGTVARVLPLLRSIEATRLLIPNHYRENVDHEAVYKSGVYEGPQVGDAIMADCGAAMPVRSALQYSVWGEFSPEDALVHGRAPGLRADRLALTRLKVAGVVDEALSAWKSQAQIIGALLAARSARRFGDWVMEAYVTLDTRPPLDYSTYADFLRATFGGEL
jgi:LmbE family N-acetylglucosaminyl deacetylase